MLHKLRDTDACRVFPGNRMRSARFLQSRLEGGLVSTAALSGEEKLFVVDTEILMNILLAKKNAILNCAREIIQKYGLSNLVMDDVALHCGMSKKTIYEVFTGKDNLVQELTTAFLKDELEVWNREIQSLSSSKEKVQYFFRFLFRSVEMLPYENISLMKKRHHASYQFLTEFYERLSRDFLVHVIEGQKKGIFDDQIEPEIFRQHVVQQFLILQEKYRELTISNAYTTWKNQLGLYFNSILFHRNP